MIDEIIVAAIGAIATVITSLITAKKTQTNVARYDAKNCILMMIMEDKMLDQEGKLPVNYQNVLNEYDRYHENNGDSYVTEKVERYKEWFLGVEKKRNKRKTTSSKKKK